MEHIFDFSQVTTWFHELLLQTLGLSEFFAILIECVLVGSAILGAYSVIAMILIFMERKVCAYFQCRIGPVRVGPWGLMQVLADVRRFCLPALEPWCPHPRLQRRCLPAYRHLFYWRGGYLPRRLGL